MATGGLVVIVVVVVVVVFVTIRTIVDDDSVAGRFAGTVDGNNFPSISNGVVSVVAVDNAIVTIIVVDVHVVGRGSSSSSSSSEVCRRGRCRCSGGLSSIV